MRALARCRNTNLLTLSQLSTSFIIKTEDPSNPSRTAEGLPIPPSAPPRSRMLVTLALGDSRLVYAVICPATDDLNSSGASANHRESLNPFGKVRASRVIFSPLPLRVSRGQREEEEEEKEEEARFVFRQRPLLPSQYLLTVARRGRTWSKFKPRQSPAHRFFITPSTLGTTLVKSNS